MKKQLFLFIFLFGIVSFSSLAQNLRYYYDQSGNRIERIIELKNPLEEKKSEEEENPIIDKLQEAAIRIYPNPTSGLITLEFPASEKLKAGLVSISNVARQVLLQQNIKLNTLQFDLSAYPAGVYIMTLQCDGEISSWRIIKI